MLQNFKKISDPTHGRRNLAALRREMAKLEVTAFIVPRADTHFAENVADKDERLKWLTGFAGSAGFCIAMMDKAAIFVDGRYTIQVKQQVDTACYTPMNFPEYTMASWLDKNITSDDVIALDPMLHSSQIVAEIEAVIQKHGAKLVLVETNLVDLAWKDQPEAPIGNVEIYPEEYAGKSAKDKLAELAKSVQDQGADAAILSLCDGIAWAFNIRGNDIQRVPVVHAFALIAADGNHKIYLDQNKLNDETQAYLSKIATICSQESLFTHLTSFAQAKKTLLIDEMRNPYKIKRLILDNGGRVIKGDDPTIKPKAIKNTAELDATRKAHIRDGKPMVQFLKWCDENLPSGNIDEIGAAKKLEALRSDTGELRDISFDTISGAGENGAICHYHVDEDSNLTIPNDKLYLFDSGAQYLDGTTDITRVVAVGEIDDEAKRNYTLVLKGMIAISLAKFPVGTKGNQLDSLARQFLWAEGKDYAHGTGHGVGIYLDVHEGPHGISPKSELPLEEGMIVSNEPGYYKEGDYGIRIENLLVVQKDKRASSEKPMYFFETLTYVPIDKRAIEVAILSPSEINWLNNYHYEVWQKLSPNLDGEEKNWLKEATSPISA